MAEELLEVVEKLQSRLSESQESRKLLKTLKKLGELPMTVDILVETGVGKTVNSLRKHDIVGEIAKNLVAKWKKLVPQSAERTSNTKDARAHLRTDKTSGYKRPRQPSPPPAREEEDDEEEHQHTYSSSPMQHYSPQYSHENLGGYHSEEYESPAEEPVPSPPRKQIRQKEPARDHSTSREQARQKRPTQGQSESRIRSEDREKKGSAAHTSSKHSRQSTQPESKGEKKKVSDGRERREKPQPVSENNDDDDDYNEESFKAPTMSFESFLSYDEPSSSKKKKKAPRPSQPVTSASSGSSKSGKANGTCSKQPKSSTKRVSIPRVPEKRMKVIEVMPTLPDIPLPAIQPNYRPLPSIDVTPLSPQRRKGPVMCDEEDAGFTGRRFNSKMVVYSGSKTSYLPKMMTLYEQCIRVLQNNIDSIDEVGGVPFEILGPVLERCTPEQLFRIEHCNPDFTEESNDLWMRHCKRDFKSKSPQEYESWREMYLRLYQEREDHLRKLTKNISSAHANKPKGRQVKMAFVNSVVKPPRDVRRRQEKFGTKDDSTCSSNSAAAPIQIKIRPSTSYSSHSQSNNNGQSSHSSPAESSYSHVPSSSASHSSRDKPQVKKIAPMMAKTIKAFKNRFSRR